MLPSSLAFFCVFQLAGASLTNTTASGCPLPDAASYNYRSVWSLLASCGLTLLICVWHVIHPSVPLPHFKWFDVVLYRFSLMLMAFFAPEFMIMTAFAEWYEAKQITQRIRANHGLRWWTMTHSHFVLIGGFALCDVSGIKEIKIDEFLSLVEKGDIVNPMVTKEDIEDKSTSDGLGKAILIVQLFWFAIQVITRLLNHLTLTLVELDTICMALLTLLLIICWWEKPRCPGRPHFFYTRNFVTKNINQEMSQGCNDLEQLLVVDNLVITTHRDSGDLLIPASGSGAKFYATLAFLLAWLTFGAAHAIAWNYEFLTKVEKIMWRASSLTLAGLPVICFVMSLVNLDIIPRCVYRFLDDQGFYALIAGVISRLVLISIMLASLRSLPSSAYETIPWTNYIPHL